MPSRFRVSYFTKNYPDILLLIDNFCEEIDVPFNQKVWHWVNNFTGYYYCMCGERTSFNRNWLDGYKKYCSPKCSQSNNSTKEKRRRTNIERYGVDNVAKLDKIKDKMEETNLKRYGKKSSFQNDEVRNKYKRVIEERYGVEHIFQSESVKEKIVKTNNERYGKDYFTQTDLFISKTIDSNNEKYGKDWYTQTDNWIDSVKSKNNEKYGKDWYTQTGEYKEKIVNINNNLYNKDWIFQSDNFIEKSKNTQLLKYGEDHYTKSPYYKNSVNSDIYKERRLRGRMEFYEKRGFELISSERIGHVKLKGKLCDHEFDIHPTNLQRRMSADITVCTICNPISSSSSGQELRIGDWIESLGIKIERGRKDIINPFEVDIYLPDLNIAIEFNGLYWHSEFYKEKNYHLNKYDLCKKIGINLINIWEDDWVYNKDIVKSILLNKFGLISKRVYARNCIIKEVSDREMVKDFFNKNHIQGYTNYKIAVGLFNNEIMVSCMLFNKPKKEVELVRFASLLNIVVVGSSSKLFKYYVTKYGIDTISSFSDISIFDGKLYEKLGFIYQYRTPPNYWWVVDGIRKHRFSYNKKKLIKLGFDPLKTEVQIMNDLGNYRIFGCGLDKWIFTISDIKALTKKSP